MAASRKKARAAAPRAAADAGEVGAFMSRLTHPLKAEIEALRGVVMAAEPRLVEGIKWNAPSYSVDGEDRVTFNLSAKDRVRLIFHRGAKVKDGKGKGPLLEDDGGLLEWASDDRAIATFRSMGEVTAGRAALKKLVKRWIEASRAN